MQRRIYFASFIFLVSLLTGFCAAQSCQTPSALQLVLDSCDILSGDTSTSDIHSWGIRTSISGSNEICVAPSTVVNTTFLTAEGICNDDQLVDANGVTMNLSQCRSRRGGWITPSELPHADIAGLNVLNQGWDTLGNKIENAVSASLQFDTTSVTMVEGTIDGGQMSTQSHLGLAAGSTLLNTLKDGGVIGSRSWGLNSGSQSAQSPRPGRLILGGYDAASRSGRFYDYPVRNTLQGKRYCPLQVSITNLNVTVQRLNTSQSVVLVGNSDPLDVCIEPYDNLFRMPDTHTGQIKTLIKQVTQYDGDPILPSAYQDTLLNLEPGIVYAKSAGEFNMTMRITIDNGLTFEVPHYELQRPLRGLDKAGKVTSNTSYNELQIYGDNPAESSPVIGKAILSQLYLYVDYEAMMFHLALQNANANAPVSVSSNSCTPTGGGLSTTEKGLIAGLAVVGALILATIGYLLFTRCWRRSISQPNSPKPPSRGSASSPPVLATEDNPGSSFPLASLSSDRGMVAVPANTAATQLPELDTTETAHEASRPSSSGGSVNSQQQSAIVSSGHYA